MRTFPLTFSSGSQQVDYKLLVLMTTDRLTEDSYVGEESCIQRSTDL
jgi:hypothetical protein